MGRGKGLNRVVGLDLAGSPTRRTGFCALAARRVVRIRVLGSDEEILEATLAEDPAVVSIDAPLSIPDGRRTIEDRRGPHLRAADRELLRLGIRFFPITLGPMRGLTTRGLRLRAALERAGRRVIESYPGAAQDLLRIPRKQAGLAPLRSGLRRRGILGLPPLAGLSHDELDAATCALVGRAFLDGDFLAIGRPQEGLMILPSKRACRARYRARGLRMDDGPPRGVSR